MPRRKNKSSYSQQPSSQPSWPVIKPLPSLAPAQSSAPLSQPSWPVIKPLPSLAPAQSSSTPSQPSSSLPVQPSSPPSQPSPPQPLNPTPSNANPSTGGIRVVEDCGRVHHYQSTLSKSGECELSLEEARWRHYFDAWCASLPKTYRDDSGGLSAPTSAVTSTACSLCSARLAASRRTPGENDGDYSKGWVQDDESDDSAATPSYLNYRRHRRRRCHEENGANRRLRRLEKTVEALSHGLILALTQHKAESGGGDVYEELHRPTSPSSSDPDEGEEAVSSDGAEALSRTLAAMGLSEDARAGVGGIRASKRSDTPSNSRGEDDNNVLGSAGGAATGSYKSLFTNKDRTPISGVLGPIMKFITSSDVFPFLKQAEAHGGLRSTQMFDLSWVLHNFLNIHGGILLYCFQKSLTTMNAISQSLGSDVWSCDPVLFRKLDKAYRKELRPHIRTDGDYNIAASAAWKSYCLELAVIFSEHFPKWGSARYFRDLSETYGGCFNPVITASFITDLTTLWTEVHPALLEVTRWLEPFIDYGSDLNRETPFYDATIALKCRVRELLSHSGVKEPEASQHADSLLGFLREIRSQTLSKMQAEMESLMDTVSRDYDPPDDKTDSVSKSDLPEVEETTLIESANRATGCRIAELPIGPRGICVGDALALHEIRVMKSYRPRLLRAGTAAAGVRAGLFRVVAQTRRSGYGLSLSEDDVFWDGIV